MKREIKFRAWDKKENKIKYSYEYPDLPCFFTLNQWQLGQEMYPIMQYTGLKDKNGKEIYEGDILKYLANYPIDYQIKYPHKKHGRIGNGVKYKTEWGCFLLDDSFEKEEVMCGFKENEQWEIIGNIYENHELLNKQP